MSRLGERGFPWRVGVWVLWLTTVGLATAVFWLTRPPAGLPPVESDAYRDKFATDNRRMSRYDVPNENHFGELERLAEPDSEVFTRSIALVNR